MAKKRDKEALGKALSTLDNVFEVEKNSNLNVPLFDNDYTDPLHQSDTVKRDYATGERISVMGGDVPYSVQDPTTDNVIEIDLSETEQKEDNNKISGDNTNPTDSSLSVNFADSVVDGYVLLCNVVKEGVKRTPEGYRMRSIQGKFDMRALQYKIDLGEDTVTFAEFTEFINDNIDEVMAVNPEVESEMRELLGRISNKRGLGMSDEQRLIFVVAQDIIPKTVGLIRLNKTIRNIEKNILKSINNSGKELSDSDNNLHEDMEF